MAHILQLLLAGNWQSLWHKHHSLLKPPHSHSIAPRQLAWSMHPARASLEWDRACDRLQGCESIIRAHEADGVIPAAPFAEGPEAGMMAAGALA